MNDTAIAVVGGTSRAALGGLAQRLVQDGLLDESAMQDAIAKAKEKRLSLVTTWWRPTWRRPAISPFPPRMSLASLCSIWMRLHWIWTQFARSATSSCRNTVYYR